MPESIIVGLVITIAGVWMGSIEVRFRNMEARMREAPSRKEVSNEIEVRMESVKVLQQEIKEDIRLIRDQLVRIADKK